MKSLRFLDRRVGYSLASLGMLLGVAAPSLVPAFASASQVTSRSVKMSSSIADDSGVDYTVTFTPSTTEATGHVDLFFCNDSPIVGQTCTAPSGFDISTVTLGSGTDASAAIVSQAANKIEIDDSTTHLTNGTPAVFVLHGVHNPTAATTLTTGLFARIQTYANATDATAAYASATAPGDGTTLIDNGGVAMAITDSIGVQAAVRETMTFCVAHTAPNYDCDAHSGALDSPSMTLGHGSPLALDSTATDTADDYAQISTNALGGAVVTVKNNNACGGLMRTGASGCDIAPAGAGNAITAGTAMFGMTVGTPALAADATNGSGAASTLANAPFDGSGGTYGMSFPSGDGTGVSGTYGASLFHTTGPVNNVNVPMTFAASASNTTPAGLYKATLNLIATGTY